MRGKRQWVVAVVVALLPWTWFAVRNVSLLLDLVATGLPVLCALGALGIAVYTAGAGLPGGVGQCELEESEHRPGHSRRPRPGRRSRAADRGREGPADAAAGVHDRDPAAVQLPGDPVALPGPAPRQAAGLAQRLPGPPPRGRRPQRPGHRLPGPPEAAAPRAGADPPRSQSAAGAAPRAGGTPEVRPSRGGAG